MKEEHMSEIMTDDEHELIQAHVVAVTLRFCALFGSSEHRITPPMIWVPGNNKTRVIVRARAATGFTLRCTVGREKGRRYSYPPELRGKRGAEYARPWTVYPEGIPIDGTIEQFSYPRITEFVGGKNHTLFVWAIANLRLANQKLVDEIADLHGTMLARDVSLFIELEKQWKLMEEAKAAAAARGDEENMSQADATA